MDMELIEFLVPTLQHTVLTKVAIALWNQADVTDLKAEYYQNPRNMISLHDSREISERKRRWQMIEDRVVEKLTNQRLPHRLKKKLFTCIKQIGLEMLKWRRDHYNFPTDNMPDCKLCWTPQAVVDRRKTAETSVNDESVELTIRYKLACMYCLESSVERLFRKIPECRKILYYSEKDTKHALDPGLVGLWSYDVKGEVNRLRSDTLRGGTVGGGSPYQHGFVTAAVSGYRDATEYFFKKLTPQEREESLRKVSSLVYLWSTSTSDVICFLLSVMDEALKNEVCAKYPYQVQICFLEWPWQSLFMGQARNYLSKEVFKKLLLAICNKKKNGFKDWDYQNLFEQFWKQSPIDYKMSVINTCECLIPQLFEAGDIDNIRLILNHITTEKREQMTSYPLAENICKDLIFKDNWNLLRFYVSEFFLSREKVIEFRQEFKKWDISCFDNNIKVLAGKWKDFVLFLEDRIENYDKKRRVEECDDSPAKRPKDSEDGLV